MSIRSEFTMTVGNNGAGVYGYSSGEFGTLNPSSFFGQPVSTIIVGTAGQIVVFDFGVSGDFKFVGRDDLYLQLNFSGGTQTVALKWNAVNTRYDKIDPKFVAALVADDGNTITGLLDDVSVGATPEMLRQFAANA